MATQPVETVHIQQDAPAASGRASFRGGSDMNRVIQRRIGALPLLVMPGLLLLFTSCGQEAAEGSPEPSPLETTQVEREAGQPGPVSAAGQEGPSAAAVPATAEPPAPQGFEEPPVFQASEILEAGSRQGAHFRVDDEVRNDGAMNHFRIYSDYGEFQAGSQVMLAARLHEIEAIAALKEFSSGEVIAEAAKKGAVGKVTAPVRGAQVAARAVTRPKEAWAHLTDASHGAMGVFRTASRHVKRSADNVGEAVSGRQDVGSATQEGLERQAGGVERFGRWYTGYGKNEKELMKELGIDPYTDNEVLLDEIHRVAGLQAAVRTGFKFVPGIPGTMVLGQINKFRNYARDLELYEDPEKLLIRNRAMANQMGVSPQVFAAFSGNDNYSPSVQSILISALHSMETTKDRGKFLELAAEAESVSGARFYMLMADQLSDIHREEIPIVQMVSGVRIPAGLAEDGRLIVPLPVDHLVWSEEIDTVFRDSRHRVRVEDGVQATFADYRITGSISPRARRELEAMGAKVNVGVES